MELVDAETKVVTPAGLQPLSSQPGQGGSERALLERLAERRSALEEQEKVMEGQAALLEAAELNLRQRADKLAAVEANIGRLVEQQKQQQVERTAELVALYQSMKPKKAALVLEGLPDKTLLGIASGMTPRKLAAIIEKMAPEKAQALSELMAESPLLAAQP